MEAPDETCPVTGLPGDRARLFGTAGSDSPSDGTGSSTVPGAPGSRSETGPYRGGRRCNSTSVSRPSPTVAVMYVQWG